MNCIIWKMILMKKKDIIDDNPAKDQELKNGLKKWLESVVDSMNGEDYIR